MNRPAVALIALAGLVAAFQFPAQIATASNPPAYRGATPTPSPSPAPSSTTNPGDDSSATPLPAPPGSAAPSPTVVVPLVDLSVSNPSPSPSPSASASDAASPSPAPSITPNSRNRRSVRTATPMPTAPPVATATPIPTDSPPNTPPPAAEPTGTTRRSYVAPRSQPTATAVPVQTPQPQATPEDLTSTSIPTQPPTPAPLAPLQPSIPDSLDDPNVQSILSRPPGQLAPFDWMIGTWNAHTTEFHGGNKGRDLGGNTYVFATTMKGRWMFGGDGKATDYFYITYDPFSRQWAIVRFNANPSYGIWLSKSGFGQNRIVFDSTYAWANGRRYRRRLTITRRAQKSFNMFDEEELPNGAWLADQSIDFTKQ